MGENVCRTGEQFFTQLRRSLLRCEGLCSIKKAAQKYIYLHFSFEAAVVKKERKNRLQKNNILKSMFICVLRVTVNNAVVVHINVKII